MDKNDFRALGHKITEMTELDTFEAPLNCDTVRMISDEVTALCPVTGQPDFYTIIITYIPDELCIESKSLKLYLQSFREQGHFCEAFSEMIAQKVNETIKPMRVEVTVVQKPRGGISIEATSSFSRHLDTAFESVMEAVDLTETLYPADIPN